MQKVFYVQASDEESWKYLSSPHRLDGLLKRGPAHTPFAHSTNAAFPSPETSILSGVLQGDRVLNTLSLFSTPF